MKPALEMHGSVSYDSSQKPCCLRCEQKLERYQLMRISLGGIGPGHGHAILTCPRCGHVEFVSDASPLLQGLQLISSDVGDGD